MAEHSPTPWRVDADMSGASPIGAWWIASTDPTCFVGAVRKEADAALIVEAVNGMEAWQYERRRLQLEAASAEKAFENADARRTLLERYYCEVYAERNRLCNIMRGLVAILETITLEDHEIALLDEAREALEEDRPCQYPPPSSSTSPSSSASPRSSSGLSR